MTEHKDNIMIRRMLILCIFMALVSGCQPQAEKETKEVPQTSGAASAPTTAADCEQQLVALLNNPVCTAATRAWQARRRQQWMEGFDAMQPTQPHSSFPPLR